MTVLDKITKGLKLKMLLLIMAATPLSSMAQKFPTIQLRTNTLYYLGACPNLGLEIQTDLGIAWEFDYIGAWWNRRDDNRFWSNYAFQTEMRYYFSSKETGLPYKGHHIGAYAQLATYDFEFGDKGVQCNTLDKTWGVGLSYGYTKPLTRHLALDFTIGLGYFQSKYNYYQPKVDNSGWARTAAKTLKCFFPTKAEITLVWTINNSNPVIGKKTDRIIYY